MRLEFNRVLLCTYPVLSVIGTLRDDIVEVVICTVR